MTTRAHNLHFTLLALLALAGCDRWRTCEERSDWHIEFSRVASAVDHEGAQGKLSRGRDGSLVLHVNDPAGNVRLGTLTVGGSALARIGSDGSLVGILPTPDLLSPEIAIAHDAQGNFFIAQAMGMVGVWAYGPGVQLRWSSMMTPALSSPLRLAADAEGHIALTGTSNGDAILYLETTGDVRWAIPTGGLVANLAFDDAGDLHVYTSSGSTADHRQYSPDGTLVDTNAVPTPPLMITADGGMIGAEYRDASIAIIRFETNGTRRWERTFDAPGVPIGGVASPVMARADNGDLLLPTEQGEGTTAQSQLIRIADETGDTRSESPMCGLFNVVGGDANVYDTIGQTGFPSVGIARFHY